MGVSCIVDSIVVKMSLYNSTAPNLATVANQTHVYVNNIEISDSELSLELSPEVLTLSLRVWRAIQTEGMYPYYIQRIQQFEPADT